MISLLLMIQELGEDTKKAWRINEAQQFNREAYELRVTPRLTTIRDVQCPAQWSDGTQPPKF
jgi:hypothetical protein